MIGLLVTLILFPLIGWSLSRGKIGEAFLIGAGLTGAVLFVAGVMHVPLVAAFTLVVIWGVGSAGWALAQRSKRDPAIRDSVHGPVFHSPLPTILMCIPLIALTFIASITPLNDFDGRAFWALKAKGIAHERAIDGPFFQGATMDPRNHYPILIPLDGAVILRLAHDLDDRQLRWLYLALLIAMALLVRDRIGRLVSPAAGAWCAALLVWIPQFAVEREGGVLSAYNDIAIAAFAAGAFFELVAADSPVRFGLWLTFLVLTKSEGLPFALVFLMIGAWTFRKRIAAPAIMTGIATVALFAWRMTIPPGDEEDVLRLLPTIPEKLNRIGQAIAAFPQHMILLPRWGLLWIAVLAAATIATRIDRRGAWLAIAVTGAMLGVYALVYVTTAWVVSELISVTADRLLMHVMAPSLFLLALAAQRTKSMKPRSTLTSTSFTLTRSPTSIP
jgi:hypothetical protein